MGYGFNRGKQVRLLINQGVHANLPPHRVRPEVQRPIQDGRGCWLMPEITRSQ